jgi:hypothetical protein
MPDATEVWIVRADHRRELLARWRIDWRHRSGRIERWATALPLPPIDAPPHLGWRGAPPGVCPACAAAAELAGEPLRRCPAEAR